MDRQSERNGVVWSSLLVCLLACFYYNWFLFQRAHVEIEIAVDQKSRFKLYWADSDQGFSEKRRAALRVIPEQQTYQFFLTDLDRVKKLRLDPLEHSGQVIIKKITLSQPGFTPFIIDLSAVQPLHDIETYRFDGESLWVRSSGGDPNFLIEPLIERAPVNWIAEAFRYLLICGLVLAVIKVFTPLRRRYAYIPILLGLVFVLVVVMAGISKQNAHPDEYVHLQAAQYYQEHWLPPHIDDPAIENTYSVYGVSRLNNGEIYYLLAGKVAYLAKSFHLPDLFALRLFNVVLFGLIVFYATRSLTARLVALPFLLSPEIWYIFSYCVSDAFGLFICFIAASEVLRPGSCFNRFISEHTGEPVPTCSVWLPILFGLLLLLKINYYPFIGFLGLFVLWRLVSVEPERRRSLFGRIALIACLGVLFAGVRVGADYYVNGIDRNEKLSVIQEKLAHPWYKPSTELHRKHIGMYLKERGTSLKGMIVHHRWFEHTLQTGTGMYGYFTIGAKQEYYRLFKWCLAAFFLYFLAALLVRGTNEVRVLTCVGVVLAAGLLGVSLYRSWTIDFQAQGRYLFPILPIIGLLIGRAGQLFDKPVFHLIVAHIFLLSLYSYIFVAIANIPRIAG